MRTYSYSIILATYKECKNLSILLPRLLHLFEKKDRDFEIIVVNDESNDGTRELVAKLIKKKRAIRLINNKKRKGLIQSLIQGTKQAHYVHLVRMDADLAHRPQDLKRLLAVYERLEFPSVLIGSRFCKKSNYFGKKIINRLFSFTARKLIFILTGLSIKDSSNNFRIFPKRDWMKSVSGKQLKGNVFLLFELLLLQKSGLKLKEEPITYKERKYGKSKLNLIKESWQFIKALPKLLQYV